MFIDIHCHIDSYKDEEIKEIVGRAKKANVGIIVNNSTNKEGFDRAFKLADKYSEIKLAFGIYPIDALSLSDKEVDSAIELIRKHQKEVVAVGEVGMDYKEDEKQHDRQKENFRKFISLSNELDKPIIVHSRKAEEDAISILEEMKAKKVVMHCFNGNMNLVKRIFDNGWSITIPTNVTFSEHFQKVIGIAPLEKIFCETDSPYLHPEKGKRNNEPGNVVASYKKIAEIKKISLNEVEKRIEENYKELFS